MSYLTRTITVLSTKWNLAADASRVSFSPFLLNKLVVVSINWDINNTSTTKDETAELTSQYYIESLNEWVGEILDFFSVFGRGRHERIPSRKHI